MPRVCFFFFFDRIKAEAARLHQGRNLQVVYDQSQMSPSSKKRVRNRNDFHWGTMEGRDKGVTKEGRASTFYRGVRYRSRSISFSCPGIEKWLRRAEVVFAIKSVTIRREREREHWRSEFSANNGPKSSPHTRTHTALRARKNSIWILKEETWFISDLKKETRTERISETKDISPLSAEGRKSFIIK